MTKTIIFKCKTPTGQVQISNLTDQDRIIDLKTALINLTGINRPKVMHGYPPKELNLNKEDILLGSLFKTLRESLIVGENISTNLKDKNSQVTNIQKNSLSEQFRPMNISKGFLNKSTGRMLRKVVPANNSCLFTAVYFCISNGIFNPNIGNELRKIIATKVREDPIQFNDAILGCPKEVYCKKIMNEDVWGGAIELAILSDHYGIEIVAVDTQNERLNRFGEDKNYDSMIFLIYDGIHYDSLYFEANQNNELVTIFPTNNEDGSQLLTMALELASEAKLKGQFTDVKNFKLKCLACSECFTGSEEANSHAKKTGHINFGEF